MYTKKHHYLAQSPRVAKLFAASIGRGTDNDPYYKALNQVLNAMVSMRGGQVTVPALKKRGRGPMALLEFPVVICSSFQKVYGVDFFADSIAQRVTDNFQLEIQYAYLDRTGTQRNEHLLLDFVEFEQLRQRYNPMTPWDWRHGGAAVRKQDCLCASGTTCVGAKGGRYCITASGGKRY